MAEEAQKVMGDYVAGASLAFGIIILAHELLGAYYAWQGAEPGGINEELILAVFSIVHLLGGLSGGYLVGRRNKRSVVQTGIFTALLAFIIESVYFLVFTGSFEGNLLALLSLIVGSVLGAVLASHLRRRL